MMFRKGKNGDDRPATLADEGAGTPPLKPFSRTGSHVPGKPARMAAPALPSTPPSAPARNLDIPALVGRRAETGARTGAADCLTVGRDIRLSGEVQCERLVIEGRADLRVVGARLLEVAEGGRFTGTARVREADIRGHFDGDLEATEKLTVREHGRLSGRIRYARIVIEAGGEIRGDTDTLAREPAAPQAAPEHAPAPALADAPGGED
ncbi:MAG: polymer-forming cytoskeletal protein [Hyphomicrobiales bacterium]|nr:polymer-forming cytoskeletal protein [Hyphomicrobiales bacterium]